MAGCQSGSGQREKPLKTRGTVSKERRVFEIPEGEKNVEGMKKERERRKGMEGTNDRNKQFGPA